MRVRFAALALAALFGGADQYLGSLSAHPAAQDVSLLSAPWLLLAFLAGCTQAQPRRAALLGLSGTAAALVGYALMTLSPIENAHLTVQTIRGFVISETPVLVGGLFTGPLFGWLGNRWRSERLWVGAILVAALVCLEPLAHLVAGNAIRFRSVWVGELAVGLLMVGYFAKQMRVRRAA